MTESIKIDLSKYFKNHYDSFGSIYCVEYKGDPLQLQSEIKSLEYNYTKRINELKQENDKLKKEIQAQKGLITVGGKQQYKLTLAYDKLRSALEEINRVVKLAHKVEDYLLGQDYTDLVDRIENKINEVLK